MFRKNTKHQQPALISAASDLPEKQRKRLENSWAGTFYKGFFCRIDESAFAGMYSEINSRPNVPVNVLVGLEALKAGFGWSDQELYEHFCYDLQVRYALGYDRLGDGDFEIRTLYYFRERLNRYNVKQSVNLLNDGQNEYVYDSANRLISVSNQSTVSSYQYNGLGDRLSQTMNGVPTNYTLDLNAGLTQVLSDGTTTYTYGLGRISQQSGNMHEYFLGDAVGGDPGQQAEGHQDGQRREQSRLRHGLAAFHVSHSMTPVGGPG